VGKKIATALAVAGLAIGVSASVAAADSTTVPGQTPGGKGKNVDADDDGYPDAGVIVVGHYYSVYAYDCSGVAEDCSDGDYYWDLGDGRVQGTVGSVDELDQETLTVCDYVVNYKGDFGNDPFLNSGNIDNHINCSGYDDNGHYNYQIVHQSDPRYRGNPDWAIWGEWEYHVLTESGAGNLVRPYSGV
jgi:hypothetical protein